MEYMWDVFISHASEDKDSLVRPLAKQLSEVYKVKVWYDEFSLEYGDSLLKSIEKGLQNSSFGVVVFSNAFFKKAWTDHEYISLSTKEMLLNEKIIIPIWYNITRKEIANYSLVLADKYAISLSNKFDIDDLAIKIVKIIRPDIHDNINRMLSFEHLLKGSPVFSIRREDHNKIPIPPIRHEALSAQMKARLKLVHNAIKAVDPRNYEKYEEDFRRSTNIDREIIITELLTAAFLDCIGKRVMTIEEKTAIYFLSMSLGKASNHLSFSQNEWDEFIEITNNYIKDINAEVVMEYKFD